MRLSRALLWALPWSIGFGLGVAVGAYLTAVGGTGAPGAQALDVTELFALPLVAALGALVVLTLGRVVATGGVPRAGDEGDDQDEGNEHDRV